MKKIFLKISLLSLISIQFLSVDAQSSKCSRGSMDSLPNIKLDNIIYYQKPLETHYGKLFSESYNPIWYNAFCTVWYHERYNDNPEEVLTYLHSTIDMPDSSKIKIVKNIPQPSEYSIPYYYFFGEVWSRYIPDGDTIITVFYIGSKSKLNNFRLKTPINHNIKNEKLDSLSTSGSINVLFFIKENGIVKYPAQSYVYNLLTQNQEYPFWLNLATYKDMLYRTNKYKISDIANGKRKFSTMEKNGSKGFIKKEDKDEP